VTLIATFLNCVFYNYRIRKKNGKLFNLHQESLQTVMTSIALCLMDQAGYHGSEPV